MDKDLQISSRGSSMIWTFLRKEHCLFYAGHLLRSYYLTNASYEPFQGRTRIKTWQSSKQLYRLHYRKWQEDNHPKLVDLPQNRDDWRSLVTYSHQTLYTTQRILSVLATTTRNCRKMYPSGLTVCPFVSFVNCQQTFERIDIAVCVSTAVGLDKRLMY